MTENGDETCKTGKSPQRNLFILIKEKSETTGLLWLE